LQIQELFLQIITKPKSNRDAFSLAGRRIGRQENLFASRDGHRRHFLIAGIVTGGTGSRTINRSHQLPLVEGFVDELADRRETAPAVWVAAKTFIKRSWRAGAGTTVECRLNLRVRQNITGAYDHQRTRAV